MSETSQRFLLKALHEAAREISSQFYGLSEQELDRRERDDTWSLRQLACHLRDAEEDFSDQIERILNTTREAHLRAVDVDLYVMERDYEHADIEPVLTEFSRMRSRNCYALGDLWGDDWERAGLHPYRGRITLSDIAHQMNEHDLEHIWQIKRILEAAPVR
jgi:hypothetical protein